MEPLDPGRNVGGSGSSRRRISSILKAPRKSSVFQDLEQQENKVESAKPVEKRISRRVSFAPADDVLLFSEDAKNVSKADSPLLLGAATTKTHDRAQVMAAKEISPQIIGIESLLNAPLHASQQRLMVHADSGGDFGEKTFVFSAEDGLMDITHNHTTHISSNAELFGEGKVIDLITDIPPSHSVQAANNSSPLLIDKKAHSSMEKRTLSTTVPFMDPDFKNFLLSLAKPSSCTTNDVLTGIKPSSETKKSSSSTSEMQSSDVDKENQVPKSLNGRRSIREAFRGSALHPEDEACMDMTEAQTGHTLLDDDDPFQCLFPSQEMYKNSERSASQAREMTKQQGHTSLDSNSVKAEKSVLPIPQENYTVTLAVKSDRGGKTDELMHITQSHTGNINSSLSANTQTPAYCRDSHFPKSTPSRSKTIDSGRNPQNPTIQPNTAPTSKQTISKDHFLSQHKMLRNDDDEENCSLSRNRSCREALSVISPSSDISMEMTEVQTGRIMGANTSMEMTEVQTGRIMGANTSMEMTEVQTGRIMGANTSMEITEVQTGLIMGPNTGMEMTEVQTGRIMGPNTSMEMTEVQTGRIMGANTSMEMTEVQTGRIMGANTSMEMTEVQTGRIMGANTSMEMTEVQTGRIMGANTSMEMTEVQTGRIMGANTSMEMTEVQTGRIMGADASMEMTEVQTGRIMGANTSMEMTEVQTGRIMGANTSMEMTEVQTGRIMGANTSMEMTEVQTGRIMGADASMEMTEVQTGRIMGANTSMEMTEVQTGRIIGANTSMEMTEVQTGRIIGANTSMEMTEVQTGRIIGANTSMEMTEVQSGRIIGANTSMEMTEVQTGRIIGVSDPDDSLQFSQKKEVFALGQQKHKGPQTSDHKGMKTQSRLSLKMQLKRDQDKVVTVDDYRKRKIGLSANNSCLDVTQSHTVYIDTAIRLDSHQNVGVSPMCGEKTVMFAADDAEMDMTRCLTTTLASDLVPSVMRQEELSCKKLSSSHNFEPSEDDVFTSLTTVKNSDAVVARKTCGTAETSDGWTVYQEDDMDMTEAKTGCIFGAEASMNVARDQTGQVVEMPIKRAALQAILPTGEMHHQTVSGKMETIKHQQHEEASRASNTADTLMKTSLKTMMQRNKVEFDSKDSGEKTVRFAATDGCMDITQCHTVNVSCDVQFHSLPNVAPSFGEKTVRFDANEAVEVSTDLKMLSHQNENMLPASGEKTVRFSMDDANMDMTGSHTVTIAHGLNLPHQKVELLPTDNEENVRFRVDDAKKDVAKSRTFKVLSSSNELPPAKENLTKLVSSDATKDVTQSYAVSSVTDSDQKSAQILDSSLANAEAINNTLVGKTRSGTKSILKKQNPESQPSIDIFPKSTEKTLEYTKNVPTMNLTHYLNTDAVSNQSLDPLMSDQPITSMRENINDTSSVKETESESCGLDSNPPSSAHNEHAALNSSVFLTSCAQDYTKGDVSSCPESNSCLKTEEHDTEKESPSLVSGNADKSPNKTETEEIGACIGMIEDPIEHLASATDVPPQSMSSKQDPHSKSFKESDLTLENNGALEASMSDELKDVKEQVQTCVPQAMESSPSTADQSPQPSQTSRRKSLADIKSSIRRLSHFINTAPDEVGMETCTAPLPHLDENSKCKTSSPVKPEVEVGSRNDTNDAEAEKPTTAEQPFVAPSMTLSSLKTQQLMSRLSVGGFKPKLPKRKSADQVKKSASDREPTKTFTINATNQLNGEDNICIQDEELLDCEDFSEMIDTTNLENTPTKDSTSNPVYRSQPLEQDVVMEDFMVSSQRQKRSLLESGDYKEDEKRQKMSTELSETAFQTEADSESNVSGIDTQTIDSSNSSPAGSSRSEIAPESTFKHSLFESQLEDYSGDKLTKLEDGTITLLEFFNLLRIDVFIHNCRQSVLPGRLSSSTDKTSLDSLKDKYINHPKQKIYEKDVQSLREKVEGLKYQMRDLGKPLKTVNKSLWEEVLKFTEKEFQSFGAKLKERHNFFRKHSKEQGHEMKEVLYANLVVANLEEQQKLRGKLNQADQMIRSLDECISELEAELDAVEGKGSEDKPGLTSLQEEMSKVTETLADSERQISELVLENEKKSKDLNRLKSEAKDLQSRNDVLDMINEWRLEENKDTGSVYTFLYKTVFLRLVYEKNTGDDVKSRSEKKMANISFEFNLDEKSYCHARLVHKLVSGYVEGESCWVEKYPTSQHVPQLLREVSLVVGRCRLVGEEIRLLKTWGSLRFDILDLSCSETQVHIVFSSLRKFTKFEVIFEAALTNQSCVFHVQSFKNVIGSTTIQQIEEVVASLSPGRNLFTRIIKKLHQTLLS